MPSLSRERILARFKDPRAFLFPYQESTLLKPEIPNILNIARKMAAGTPCFLWNSKIARCLEGFMIDPSVNLLVVSAHPADFVWRAGGTIAKYLKHGANVALVILSYGVRGESNDLWNAEGQTADKVKKIRQGEIEAAGKHLGVEQFEIWDYDDYYMEFTPERMDRMVRKIRQVKPHHIITHGPKDVFNPDHESVSRFVFEASVLSISNGVRIEGCPTAKQARIFGFEPHQSEICDFKPEVIIDITETFERKAAAMQVFKAQKHLIDYYTDRAKMRGNHARRCSGNKKYQYAEAFSRFFPYVGEELV